MRRWLLAAAALVTVVTSAFGGPFRDPLETPAALTTRVSTSPLIAVAQAGARWVAVGLRGLIVYSDDAGIHWTQAQVRVSSDLVAVHFPTPTQGWAVGHDGVILHSSDAGTSWVKQLDGRSAATMTLAYYDKRVEAGDKAAASALKAATLNYQNGPDLPFLGVWFANEREGYVVGSFGLMVVTHDGGASWEPWLDHIDNPGGLNLNAVRGVGADIFVVGERGMVFRLDHAKQRFAAISTGYAGSFFDIVGEPDCLLAFGLRGTVLRSTDRGTHWAAVTSGIDSGLTAGAVLGPGEIVLVSQAGQLLLSRDSGLSFKLGKVSSPSLFTGVMTAGAGRVLLVGMSGAQQENLDTAP